MISFLFIDRPRLALVLSIVITIAGLLALLRIPVAQFPNIVPPRVSVQANYPGANAETVEDMIYKLDQRHRRLLQPNGDLQSRLRSGDQYGQRPESRPPRGGAGSRGGPAARRHRAPAILGLPSAHHPRLGLRPLRPAVPDQLCAHQPARPALACPWRRRGAAVQPVPLQYADLDRHRPADEPRSHACRHRCRRTQPKRPGAGGPDRRAARPSRPTDGDPTRGPGMARRSQGAREHRSARQPGRLATASQRRSPRRARRPILRPCRISKRLSVGGHRHISVTRRQCRHYRAVDSQHARPAQPELSGRRALRDHVRHNHVRHGLQSSRSCAR